MRFLVASDSHGRVSHLFDMLEKAHTHRFPADGLFFLGDGLRDLEYLRDMGLPLFPVSGNCDLQTFGAPRESLVMFEGYRIYLTHGDGLSVKSGESRIVAYAARKKADVVLYGHTHVPTEHYYHSGETVGGVTLEKPMCVLNPGSIGEYRDGYACGFGVLELTESGVLWNRVSFL